jgi:hypothetical protein
VKSLEEAKQQFKERYEEMKAQGVRPFAKVAITGDFRLCGGPSPYRNQSVIRNSIGRGPLDERKRSSFPTFQAE